MRKDIYVYYSDHEYLNDFRRMVEFTPPYEYDIVSYSKLHQEEIGLLQFPGMRIHLLLDSGSNHRCPWCDCEVEPEIKTSIPPENISILPIIMYAQCINCGCTGPRLNISSSSNKTYMDECEGIVRARWQSRAKKRVQVPSGQ